MVLGDDGQGNTYVVREHSKQFKEIDYWVEYANKVRAKYGKNIPFYCDTARVEHIDRFRREGINARNGNKSVLSGIEFVASALKTKHMYVVESATESFMDEIYNYIWDDKNDAPVKDHDHAMDAWRYAYYTKHYKPQRVQSFKI
jgi:phage terminase large subunit